MCLGRRCYPHKDIVETIERVMQEWKIDGKAKDGLPTLLIARSTARRQNFNAI